MQCPNRVFIRSTFALALPFIFVRQPSGFNLPVIGDIPLVWKSDSITRSN
jgi:hypothetical protein